MADTNDKMASSATLIDLVNTSPDAPLARELDEPYNNIRKTGKHTKRNSKGAAGQSTGSSNAKLQQLQISSKAAQQEAILV